MANNPWGDFDVTKILSSLQLPNVNVQTLVDSQQKNIKALEEANRQAIEGFQALFKRQAEMLQKAVEEASKAATSLSAGDPKGMLAKQGEVAKAAVERTLADMREISELVVKASQEAGHTLNKRFQEGIEELKTLTKK
jgi:phasin family protein